MDCFVRFAPLRKRFAFVAGNDGEKQTRTTSPSTAKPISTAGAKRARENYPDQQEPRPRPIDLDDGTRALVTVHPSYLLRLPDAEAKTRAREHRRFVQDLKLAADVLRKSAHAA